MKVKYAVCFLILVMGFSLISCSSDTKGDEPSVNPWVRANDTVRIGGALYLNGSKPSQFDNQYAILIEATELTCNKEWQPFSMTDEERNCFVLNLEGREAEALHDWPTYRKVLLEQIKARPQCLMPYDKEVAQLPVYTVLVKVSVDNIVGVDVVTETDFNSTHPAGSSMNDVCEFFLFTNKPIIDLVKNWRPGDPDPKDYVGDILKPYLEKTSYTEKIDALDYSCMEWPDPRNLYFKVKALPSQTGSYTLAITVRMSSGKTLKYRYTVRYK